MVLHFDKCYLFFPESFASVFSLPSKVDSFLVQNEVYSYSCFSAENSCQ
uniref:Uncharacterized protein n=1 Tax=Rhizophora mucronata TaxID=61149 RepID=A0A2P2QTN6_RHIMU